MRCVVLLLWSWFQEYASLQRRFDNEMEERTKAQVSIGRCSSIRSRVGQRLLRCCRTNPIKSNWLWWNSNATSVFEMPMKVPMPEYQSLR